MTVSKTVRRGSSPWWVAKQSAPVVYRLGRCPFKAETRSSILPRCTIVKCYQGIVIGRYDYSTVRVRPTLSDKTVIRLSVLATLLTNRHDNTKLILCVNGNDGGVAADCKSVPSW